MKNAKIFQVTREGDQNCWIAAANIVEAIKKARVYFRRNYVGRSVIIKAKLVGTVDA